MRKIMVLLCTIIFFYHGSALTMYRSLIRFGASSLTASLVFYYYRGLTKVQQELNRLDHEVIVQFYQNDFEAKNGLFQALKYEAMVGKVNWFDPYFSTTIRQDGFVNSHITLASQSHNTQCYFKYDYDQNSGQEVLSRYTCNTCLDHEQFKRHIAQGISEGRIK